MNKLILLLVAAFFVFSNNSFSRECTDCHQRFTPQIVSDWKISKHFENEVGCETCHGDEHNKVDNTHKAKFPTAETCATCHDTQVEQYQKGKHSMAWASMKAMPTLHYQPMGMIEGMKGCGSCHKLGFKSEDDLNELRNAGMRYGTSTCSSCHTRHTFSKVEAQQPQACQTCHQGFDHAQWEMYSGSKHGVRFLLKQNGTLPKETAAPTCQTCHMPNGDHEVRTAWGFLAVRLPMPEDKQWSANRAKILQALGVLDPNGNPTNRLDAVKAVDLARLTQEDWQRERDKMIKICSECHSKKYAEGELRKGDEMIRQADSLMAEAITIVEDLYKENILQKPEGAANAFPDILTFHDAPTSIEQKLFVMFMEHRMRTFQGTFHSNPDYAFWYGWSEMQRDLTEIRDKAKQLRINAEKQ